MSAAGGPRLLLRRLREIMAEQTSAQMRLDKLVTVIASNMVAEVCSIYLRRAGKMLELFATEGLNRAAVHNTRLKEGEGLVGLVAETAEAVNLSDAPADPHFSYRPETGEDPFKSFLGVPIVRGGQVFGVLTVQNKAERIYAEEEVEALQTVAMVLAEVVAQGGFFNVAELDEPELRIDRPRKFMGEGLSEGVAVGRVVLHEPRVKVERMIADNPVEELKRLEEAIGSLARIRGRDAGLVSELDLTGEGREVIEAYRLFAYDQGWRQRMRDAVRTGLTAEAAVERVQDETRLRVQRLGDPILRERAHDLDDLARRLLRHLTGDGGAPQSLPRDAVLVARNMGPAELLDYGRDKLLGLVLEEAASTTHVAIVARSMGLPLVSSLEGIADNARAGDAIVVDGETGEVHLRPPAEIVAAFEEKRALRRQAQARFAAVRDLPAVTKDGVPIRLMMNAGLEFDMPHLKESGADGIGLFRTELQFMIGETMPRLADQTRLLQIHSRCGGRQAGGVPHPRSGRRQGAALCALGAGGKSRAGLARHPHRARSSRAAALPGARAADGRRRAHLAHPAADGQRRGRVQPRPRPDRPRDWSGRGCSNLTRPTQVLVGAMLEVPALAFMLPQLMRSADFVSIGSNDLLSLAFAVDRTNPRVARRYDNLNPASLTLIRLIVQSAAENSGDLSLCGEMAGRPAGRHGAAGAGHPHPVHAAGPDRPHQDDDSQPQSGRGGGLRGPAVRPDRPFPAHPAFGLCRRAGNSS